MAHVGSQCGIQMDHGLAGQFGIFPLKKHSHYTIRNSPILMEYMFLDIAVQIALIDIPVKALVTLLVTNAPVFNRMSI